MRTPVKHRPGRRSCGIDFWAGGSYDPNSTVLVERIAWLPAWELHGEDGSVFGIAREGDELSAWVTRPGQPRRTAYGSGPNHDGPIEAWDDWRWPQPDELELRVINAALYPHAIERPWSELEAEAKPCDHRIGICHYNRTGRASLPSGPPSSPGPAPTTTS